MFGKRWRSRNWWQDESCDLGFGSSRRWKNKVTKKPKNKRRALQWNFDFLPDLDEQYDLLPSALPLIGVTSGATSSMINVDDIDDVDSDNDVLIGSLRGEIVGIQYYKGTVNNHEMVNLVREPANKYDPNAVKVTNVAGQQVGHIKRELAKALAFILDFHLARVEGVVPFGTSNVYSMPVDLTFWGVAEKRTEVVANLRKHGFVVQEGSSQVVSAGKSSGSSQPQRYGSGSVWSASVSSRRTFLNPTEVKSELDNLFEHLDEGDKLTEAEPCAAICSKLFLHQKQALSWMIRSENSDRLPPFWQKSGTKFLNTLTGFSTDSKPPSINGGILADDMGLGKTLEIIALILTNFKNGQPLAVPVAGKIRPSRIAKDNRLKIYRHSAKEDISFDANTESTYSRQNAKSKCIEENFCSADSSETLEICDSDVPLKQSSKAVGPKKLLLLPNNFDSVGKSETVLLCSADMPSKQSSRAVGPKKLLLLPKVNSLKPVVNINLESAKNVPNPVSQPIMLTVPRPQVLPVVIHPVTGPGMLTMKVIPRSLTPSQVTGVSIEPRVPANGLLANTAEKERVVVISGSNVESQPVLIKDTVSSIKVALESEAYMATNKMEDSNNNSECRQGVLTATENLTSKMDKDADYCINLPKICVQLPVSSRPKRATRKPVCYGDYVNGDSPVKKTKKGASSAAGAALVISCDQAFAAPENVCTGTDLLAAPMNVDPCDKHVTKYKKKLGVRKTKVVVGKHVPTIAPLAEQLTTINQPVQPALPSLPVEWIDTSEECTFEVTSAVSVDATQSSAISPANKSDSTLSAKVCVEKSGSWLFANHASSSASSSIQPTITIYDVSDNDEELPDLPELDMAELAIPAVTSLTEFGKSSGRTQTKGPRATLIVCPLSTLSNWLDQLEQHVDEKVLLQVYTYYGPSRTSKHADLGQHDIVLTTYQTLAADVKSNGPLQKVQWLRLVLDEGHTIRNAKTQMSKAIFTLKADRKWIVTGTPIQNSIKDLWSLMKFLNVEPFHEKLWWDRTIERPVARGDENAMKRVQNLLGAMTLRRMKNQIRNGKPIVELPKKDIFIEHITMSDEERQLYDTMQKEGKLVVNRYVKQGTLLRHYGEVLAIMMRLRQMCCHPFLVVKAANAMKEIMEEAEANGKDTNEEEFRKQLIEKILMVLNSGSEEECPICLEGLKTPVITHCAHLFCRICIEQVIHSDKDDARCPMCRGAVSIENLVEVPPNYNADEQNVLTMPAQQWYSSSKVDALMNALLRLRSEDKTTKSIVVSQFTSYLSLIEIPLRNNGFHFVRLDGSMSSKQRTAAIEAFSDLDQSSPTIFLLSLMAGGVGINLNAASRIFLMDPAWNPATEEQCFDRCHRLGQTRDVVVTKFIVENSVEERMLLLQEKKRKLAAGVLGSKPSAEEKRLNRIQDIKDLVDL